MEIILGLLIAILLLSRGQRQPGPEPPPGNGEPLCPPRTIPSAPYAGSRHICGITWSQGSHQSEASGSDNWPMTWSDDGHQYTSWGDGGGFGGSNSNGRVSLGVARVEGDHNNYDGDNVNGGVNPEGATQWASNSSGPDGGGKCYGIISIAGVLYMWVTPGSQAGIYQEFRLWRSTNKGRNWERANWSFDSPHFNATFVNFGQDYAGAKDGFVYTYTARIRSTSGEKWDLVIQKPGDVYLLRAPVSSFFNSASNWEWVTGFNGGVPTWGSQSQAVPVFHDPRGVGWNWSAIYNPGLKRYLFVTEHSQNTSGGVSNRESSQSRLGIFDAPEPWGPWSTVVYEDNWMGFRQGERGPFYWNFAPKWWRNGGKDFTLVFTGGPGAPWDSWNTIDGSFQVPT